MTTQTAPNIGPAEPWCVRETAPDLSTAGLRRAESLFALGNGHLGLRANLDENEPCGMPGTYLNSLFEQRDMHHAEAGYAFPEHTETIVDAPNGKLIGLLVDGEPFDMRTGEVRFHERVLDLRAGTLRREVEWVSRTGATARIVSTRLVSFPHPSVAAIRYEVFSSARLEIRSDVLANEDQPEESDDPRAADTVHHPLQAVHHADDLLQHCTRRSGIAVSVAVRHDTDGESSVRSGPDRIRCTITGTGSVRVDKFLAYAWGDDASPEKARADRDKAAALGFEGLLDAQRTYLDEFWESADVELDGDPEVQQAVRFGLFHVLQAGAQAGPHPIAAKGLTGNGYDGHTLWDTETYVLPVLTYTHPACVGLALRWRHSTLGAAQDRAAELRLSGAAYPWRTISGPECSGYWPAGTAALHVNADIADAVLRYHAATGDDDFMAEAGLEILVETARLWCHVAHVADDGRWHISGVTGPDEYTALMDDNIYTNLMAQANLRGAAALAGPDISDAERANWLEVADGLHLPYDERRQVHEQAAGFVRLQEWDFPGTGDDEYPLMLHFPYLDLYRKQVVKQADVVLAMALRPDAFTPGEKDRNFRYYEARTVRDSSLSAPAQAVLAAETGHLELAHDYLAESALLDLRAGGEGGGDGLHIAALAGSWIALVMGFGGFRDAGGRPAFAPRLPGHLPRLRFRVRWRDSRLLVTVSGDEAMYEVTGPPLEITHHGEPVTVDGVVTRPIPYLEDRAAPPTPRPSPRRIQQIAGADAGESG